MTTTTDLPYRVGSIRELTRGLEADVILGVVGPPGGNVRLRVLIAPGDSEYSAIRKQLDALFAKRAQQAVKDVLNVHEVRQQPVPTPVVSASSGQKMHVRGVNNRCVNCGTYVSDSDRGRMCN